MASSSSSSSTTSTITSKFIGLMLLLSLQLDLLLGSAIHLKNQTSFRPNREIQKLRRVEAYLSKINKPSIKTIHVTKQTLYGINLLFFSISVIIFVIVKL